MEKIISGILPHVQVPSRYTGKEINAYHRTGERVSFALAYPDIYEIGMSSLGVRIIYGLLNEMEGISCERVFAPAADMESILRERKIPLFSIESGRPLTDFDILGFSLSSELNYTNMLNMLELSSIPAFSRDRKDGCPLVIAGGNSIFNFAPLSPFVDLFIVGEGEEIIPEVVRFYEGMKGQGREKILSGLAGIEGTYVPAFPAPLVRKRFVRNFEESFFPERWLVPLTEIVHDRVSLEIMRGCGQGCFFCQAGSCWKPVRTRSASRILDMASRTYRNTGYEEISLLSFSSGDHPGIGEIVDGLLSMFRKKRVTISFPSVRIDTFSFELASRLREIKKTGLTFAPETGEKLRFSIGKRIKDSELVELALKARESGWKQIKLYFMVGLPGETEEDILDSARLINELSRIISIKASFNTFVPKPHSRFERERFISQEEYTHRKNIIVSKVRNSRFTRLTFHSYEMSRVEAFLGRGDEKLSDVILDVRKRGGRMENWDEFFNYELWEQSFLERGLPSSGYLGRLGQESLPWDKIKV